MAVHKFSDLKGEYGALYHSMVTAPSKLQEVVAEAKGRLRYLTRYKQIEAITGVPAVLIMALHNRESDGDFNTYLGNGEPLSRVTQTVPKGRGPFATFEEGAVDALQIEGYAAWGPWTIELALFAGEKYNGWGYRDYHNEPTPYVWAGTSVQQPGKYVADGQFNRTAYDTQIGIAPLMATLIDLEPSLALPMEGGVVVPVPLPTPRPPVPPVPTPTPEQVPTFWEIIIGILRSLLASFGVSI